LFFQASNALLICQM